MATPPAALSTCPHCGCSDLFIRKDFPQRLGITLVVAASLAFLILASFRRTLYIGVFILIGVTLIDALLWFFVGQVTVCYRCRSEFRGIPLNPQHGPFDLSTAEKYRSEAT